MNKSCSNAFDLDLESQPPIFLQGWWLNIARECCHSIPAVEDDGFTKGSLLYWPRPNRFGMPFGYNPPLSHLTGFAVDQSLTPDDQNEVIDELVGRLSRRMSFHFIFNASASNASYIRRAFKAAGFYHSTHRSYLRTPRQSDVLSGIKNPEHRRRINAAEKKLEAEAIDAKTFLEMYDRNLRAKGEECHFPLTVAQKLIEEGQRRGQIYILALKRKRDGGRGAGVYGSRPRYDAAVACAVDFNSKRVYYWMSTRAHGTSDYKPQRDAPKVLVKKAMEYAQALRFTFDADGASTMGAEEFQKNSLGLHEWEDRDVFMRLTRTARFYEEWRPKIKSMVSLLRSSPSSRATSPDMT